MSQIQINEFFRGFDNPTYKSGRYVSGGFGSEIDRAKGKPVPQEIKDAVNRQDFQIIESYGPKQGSVALIARIIGNQYSVLAIATREIDDRNRPLIAYRYFWLESNDNSRESDDNKIDGIGTLLEWWLKDDKKPCFKFKNDPDLKKENLNYSTEILTIGEFKKSIRQSPYQGNSLNQATQKVFKPDDNLMPRHLHCWAYDQSLNTRLPLAWAWNVGWLEHPETFTAILCDTESTYHRISEQVSKHKPKQGLFTSTVNGGGELNPGTVRPRPPKERPPTNFSQLNSDDLKLLLRRLDTNPNEDLLRKLSNYLEEYPSKDWQWGSIKDSQRYRQSCKYRALLAILNPEEIQEWLFSLVNDMKNCQPEIKASFNFVNRICNSISAQAYSQIDKNIEQGFLSLDKSAKAKEKYKKLADFLDRNIKEYKYSACLYQISQGCVPSYVLDKYGKDSSNQPIQLRKLPINCRPCKKSKKRLLFPLSLIGICFTLFSFLTLKSVIWLSGDGIQRDIDLYTSSLYTQLRPNLYTQLRPKIVLEPGGKLGDLEKEFNRFFQNQKESDSKKDFLEYLKGEIKSAKEKIRDAKETIKTNEVDQDKVDEAKKTIEENSKKLEKMRKIRAVYQDIQRNFSIQVSPKKFTKSIYRYLGFNNDKELNEQIQKCSQESLDKATNFSEKTIFQCTGNQKIIDLQEVYKDLQIYSGELTGNLNDISSILNNSSSSIKQNQLSKEQLTDFQVREVTLYLIKSFEERKKSKEVGQDIKDILECKEKKIIRHLGCIQESINELDNDINKRKQKQKNGKEPENNLNKPSKDQTNKT